MQPFTNTIAAATTTLYYRFERERGRLWSTFAKSSTILVNIQSSISSSFPNHSFAFNVHFLFIQLFLSFYADKQLSKGMGTVSHIFLSLLFLNRFQCRKSSPGYLLHFLFPLHQSICRSLEKFFSLLRRKGRNVRFLPSPRVSLHVVRRFSSSLIIRLSKRTVAPPP